MTNILNGFLFPDNVDPIDHLKNILIEFVKDYDHDTRKRLNLTDWLIELYKDDKLIEANDAVYVDLSKSFRKKYPTWRSVIGIEDPPRTPRQSSRLKEKRTILRLQQDRKIKSARKLFERIAEIDHE